MHLLSEQRLARLKSNKRAYDHFEKSKTSYIGMAQSVAYFVDKYPQLKNEETRVGLVAAWILELDPTIWALKSDTMTAQELADTYARFIVGHEKV